MAADDETLALLQEIRDIQKQHFEMYRAQSERAINLSAVAVRRQRYALWFLLLVVAAAVAYMAYLQSQTARWEPPQAVPQQFQGPVDRAA